MNFQTLRDAFSDQAAAREAAAAAHVISIQANETARVMIENMDRQVQLEVAKATGAIIEIDRAPARTGQTSDAKCGVSMTTTAETSLDAAETQIMRLAETLPDIPDPILELRGRLERAAQFVKALRDKLDDEVFGPWLNAHGKRYESGDLLYVVGPDKVEEPKSNRQIIIEIEKATIGDYDAVCDALSKNAFKPGTVKKIVGEEKFKELYNVTYRDKVSVRAIPKKFFKQGATT